MRAGATTPEQKTLVSFYFDHDREKERKKFRLGPPITQYYAWLLATDYFFVTYGLCGSVGLPQQNGVEWEVPCYVGIVGDPKTISVHLRTGIISCPGQHTIYDAVLFLASPMTFAEDRRSTEEADDGDAELER